MFQDCFHSFLEFCQTLSLKGISQSSYYLVFAHALYLGQ